MKKEIRHKKKVSGEKRRGRKESFFSALKPQTIN